MIDEHTQAEGILLTRAHFTNMDLTSISAWIHKNEIAYPFPNHNAAAVKFWEWISNPSHNLLGMWLLIHDGIKVKPCIILASIGFWTYQLNSHQRSTLYVLIFSEATYTYIHILCHSFTVTWHSWNPSSSKVRIFLFYKLNIMGADDLAMQGAKASATMILT